MPQFTVPLSRRPRRRSDPLQPNWRTLLATLVVAGLATIGATTFAAPAAAEEIEPSAVVADESAPAAAAEQDLAVPDIGISVTPLTCSTDRNAESLLTLTGLTSVGIVAFDVQGPNFEVGGSLDEFGETEEIELVGMPPGNYYAYAEWHPFGEEPAPTPVFDWVGFAIEPCQPGLSIDVTECTAAGGTGSAEVRLSSLVAGVEYAVWVTDVGAPDGTPYGEPQWVVADSTGTADLTFPSLPGGREYSVWVDGLWEAIPPWEEPPFIGNGGNFDPLETVELFAAADFTLQPCPAAPVTTGTVTPALAATGTDSTTGLLLGALTLIALGGASLVVRRLVPSRARR